MAAEISSVEIRAGVQKFWDILCGRSKDRLEDLYSASAIVFTGKAKRSERGAQTAVRRMRQFVDADSAASAELDPIEVQIAGDAAIASYTYRFHSSKKGKDGSREHRNTLFGRSTQIFQRDARGVLRIVHEHLSSAAPPAVEKAKG
ncbi:MAG TPA: nuclear transport factor 2 family protein [Candidatus Acidoferrales bacterium]|nr:nuclear transport factor 2 family protein [Candidatus Acidoferrales bacterium]